jgi:chemotaxis protein MotB
MKTVAGIVLAVLLVAAIVFGVIIHGKYSDTKEALFISEKNSSELNEKVTQLTEEVSWLNEKIHEREGGLKELENAQKRISKLEDALKAKDQRRAEFQEELSLVKGDLEKERKAEEALRSELTAKETVAVKLQEKLGVSESGILSLEQENARQQEQIEGLRDRLSDLEGEKAGVESKVDQLQTTYEALIADLNEQIEKREVTIEAFEKRISVSFVDRILFDFGKETITPEGREVLQKVGGILKGVQGRRIRVIGHTDDIPILPEYRYRFPSNWELSAARAAAVVRQFEKETGLDPRNLEAVGRSFYQPVAGNETAEGRSQNRRVEIIIAPQLK